MSAERPAFEKFQIAKYPDLAPALIVKVSADPRRKEVDALVNARPEIQSTQTKLALFDVAGYHGVDFLEVATAVLGLKKTFSGMRSAVIDLQTKSAVEAALSFRALPLLKVYLMLHDHDFDVGVGEIEKKDPEVAALVRAYKTINPVVMIDLLAKRVW